MDLFKKQRHPKIIHVSYPSQEQRRGTAASIPRSPQTALLWLPAPYQDCPGLSVTSSTWTNIFQACIHFEFLSPADHQFPQFQCFCPCRVWAGEKQGGAKFATQAFTFTDLRQSNLSRGSAFLGATIGLQGGGPLPQASAPPRAGAAAARAGGELAASLPASRMSHDEVLPLPSLPPSHVAEPERVAGHTSSSAWLLHPPAPVMHVIVGDCLLININYDLY